MTINLRVPKAETELKPRITVIGVGGAGGNAVNNMVRSSLQGVEFVAANTDAQALTQSLAERKIQLGVNINHGLGAGAKPEVGKAAAEESIEEIMSHLQGSNMVFITAGMGGGTGTGAAAVVARASRELGILTVGVVTKPFTFEGGHRMRLAEQGLEELQQYVDTLIVIPNQNLFRIANERTTFADAFKMADDVLYSGVRGVTDLITMPGLINLDFADIQTVMAEMGKAMMGTGEAEGDRRALDAAEAAINNPLLDDISMKGARAVLINITGGLDMTLFEVDEAANRIRSEVDPEANIIFGAFFEEKLAGRMRISIVAAGMDTPALKAMPDARAGMGSPYDMRLRPQKVVPHADIIASARKPLPQTAPNTTQTSYSSARLNTESRSEPKTESSINISQPSEKSSTVSTSTAESSSLSSPSTYAPLGGSDAPFVAPKPVQVEPGSESVTLTDRIVVAEMSVEQPRSVPVDLKQERPMEKAFTKTPASSSATSPSSNSAATAASSGMSGYADSPSRQTTSGTAANETRANLSSERSTESSRREDRSNRRGPGLFERMVGGVLGKAEAPASSNRVSEPTFNLEPANEKAANQSAPASSSGKSTKSASDDLDNDPLAPKDSDEMLDIPAFLRRQTN